MGEKNLGFECNFNRGLTWFVHTGHAYQYELGGAYSYCPAAVHDKSTAWFHAQIKASLEKADYDMSKNFCIFVREEKHGKIEVLPSSLLPISEEDGSLGDYLKEHVPLNFASFSIYKVV